MLINTTAGRDAPGDLLGRARLIELYAADRADAVSASTGALLAHYSDPTVAVGPRGGSPATSAPARCRSR